MLLLTLLTRHSTKAMAVAVVLGLAWPALASTFQPLIQPAVLLLLTGSLLRIDMEALRRALSRPGPSLIGLAWVLVAGPALAMTAQAMGWLSGGVGEGILLNALTPPLMGAPALALILGLDFTLTVVVTVIATLLFPLGLAAAASLGGLSALPADRILAIVPRILLMVGLPVGLAVIGRQRLGPQGLIRRRQTIDATMVALLIFLAIALMDGANGVLRTAPGHALKLAAAACLFNLLGQIVTALVFWARGSRQALTFGLLSGNRNLGLMLGILTGFTGSDFAAYVAFAQIPIYTLPVVSKFLLHRIFPHGVPQNHRGS
jgi:BASS family bile acid:Na+ symporter